MSRTKKGEIIEMALKNSWNTANSLKDQVGRVQQDKQVSMRSTKKKILAIHDDAS